MKKFLIGIVAVIVGVVAFLFFGLNPALRRFQPEIASALSSAVQRPVEFQTASVSLFPTAGITLSGLSIGKGLAGEISIAEALLKASPLEIIKGSVSVSEVLVRGLSANIKKLPSGALVIGGKSADPATAAPAPNSAPQPTSAQPASFSLKLDSARFEKISIAFIDESVSPAKTIKAEDLELWIKGDLGAEKLTIAFGFDGSPGAISIPGAINKAAGTKLALSGTIRKEADRLWSENLSLSAGGLTLPIALEVESIAKQRGKIGLRSEAIDLQNLAQSFGQSPPALVGAALKGLDLALTGDGGSESGTAMLKLASITNPLLPLRDISVDAVGTKSEVQIRPSKLGLLGGSIHLTGLQQLAGDQTGSWSIKGSGLDLGKVPGNTALRGDLSTINLTTKYLLPNPKGTASGNLSLSILKGEIAGVNILADVLRGIKDIPGVQGALLSSAPASAQAVLNAEGTAFDSLSAELSFDAPQVTIRSIALSHPLYSLHGTGTASFSAEASLKVQFRLAPILVSGMVAKSQALQYLTDRDGNIELPVEIKKSASSTLVLPDAERLIGNAARAGAKKAAEKALDKVAPGLGGAAKVFDSLF